MNIIKKTICFILLLLLPNVFSLNAANALIIPKEKESIVTEKFIGKWDMQTIVTKSNCPYILVGSTTKSNLEIKTTLKTSLKKYLLKGLWKGGKWTKSIGVIKVLNEKEAITERVTKIKTNDKNNWKAILIDHLKIDDQDVMHSESIVIQYKNDTLVGDYKTYSYLTKSED